MKYADFAYYKSDFEGNIIPSEADFQSVIQKASAYIDRITLNRAKDHSETDEVRKAACAVAEIIHQNNTHYGISSENNDGYSVTYVNNARKELRDIKNAAYLFLPDALIYRGMP